MPGAKSQLSNDLSNVKRDIRRAVAHGNEEEIDKLRSKRDTLQEQQDEVQEARRAARVNSHATAEQNRGIQATEQAAKDTQEAVREATRHSEAYFAGLNGAGSSDDKILRGQAMMA